MQIDAVFSGGGVKAFAYVGVLSEMEKKGLIVKRAAGTSAGAIIASFLLAGYKAQDIEEMLDKLDLTTFMDCPKIIDLVPISKWLVLFFKRGIYRGDCFESWLESVLLEKGIRYFGDLPKGSLRVVASDLTLGRLVVLPDDLQRVYGIDGDYFSIAKAVRMSAGFPFFFRPQTLTSASGIKSQLVDGGMLSNFPLWLFGKENACLKRPVLGIKLTAEKGEHKKKQIRNAYELTEAMISTMKTAHDSLYISNSNDKDIMDVPVKGASAMELDISPKTKIDLIQNGKDAAAAFLAGWPN